MYLPQKIYAHGKLLLTGEYLILHGAESLALPLRKGQEMIVTPDSAGRLEWKASDINGVWFTGVYDLPGLSPVHVSDDMISSRLVDLLMAARVLNPAFLAGEKGYKIETILEFDRQWGFGSSSSLIALVAELAGVDALQLHQKVSNGSGYDVACAISDRPVLFSRNGNEISHRKISFDPVFSDSLYFVYLGKKQNSTAEVDLFLERSPEEFELATGEISDITSQILSVQSLENFNLLMLRHEQLIAEVIGQSGIGEILFPDFQGVVKSLGAWGGDFILASSPMNSDYIYDYFISRGYLTIFRYHDLVLKPKADHSNQNSG